MRRIGASEKLIQIDGKPGRNLGHLAGLESRRLGEKPRQLVPLGAQCDRPQMSGAVEILRLSRV